MKITQIKIQNFRSIKDETLLLDDLTILAGANGSGKSTFLKALELFYSSTPTLDIEDFYNKDVSQEVIIAVSFACVSQEPLEQFKKYIQGNQLTVESVFSWDENKKRADATYHGAKIKHDGFDPVRLLKSATEKKKMYTALKELRKYSSLPDWSNANTSMEELEKWEDQNPDECQMGRDDGNFFGYSHVGQSYITKHVNFLFIPAIRDVAQDAAEGKTSVIAKLMELIVKGVIAKNSTIKDLKDKVQSEYEKITDPKTISELQLLESKLTDTLKVFVPDAQVNLGWSQYGDVDIPYPKANVRLVEDGYSSSVTRVGHGLQRAFIFTLLQHLLALQSSTEEEGTSEHITGAKLPNLILAIEEPELYQHPNRQRHFAKVLNQLADGNIRGVAASMQIVYCTHSPFFVGIDNVDKFRLCKKHALTVEAPKETKIVQTNLDAVAKRLWEVQGSRGAVFSGATLAPRLKAIMTPWMNEGFFADKVVLVEGESDRAAILGVAAALGHDLESQGIAVIPCSGKANIDRPALIFNNLGIKTYLLWDGDCSKQEEESKKQNKCLLKLCGLTEEEWPDFVDVKGACFKEKLEPVLEGEIDSFVNVLDAVRNQFALKKDQAMKNASVIEEVIKQTSRNGESSSTLNSIIEHIIRL